MTLQEGKSSLHESIPSKKLKRMRLVNYKKQLKEKSNIDIRRTSILINDLTLGKTLLSHLSNQNNAVESAPQVPKTEKAKQIDKMVQQSDDKKKEIAKHTHGIKHSLRKRIKKNFL